MKKVPKFPMLYNERATLLSFESMPVRRGVSKEVEDSRRPSALRAGHPRNNRKAVSGVAHPQGVERLGMVSPGETLGSPWIRDVKNNPGIETRT
jgi:hypothetical protein